MFGEYMVYVNNKPVIIVCDNMVYVKQVEEIFEFMKEAEKGFPYKGAKEHYVLDIDNSELSRKVVTVLEKVTPLPKLSKKGSMYLQSIVEYFGENIIDQEGELKRSELASLIYEDEEKRQGLNRLTFMYVVQEIKNKINELVGKSLIVIDAPLLFESKLDQICDFVIGITAKEEQKIQRICNRDHISYEMAKKRLTIQITEDEIQKKADFVIQNNGDVQVLEQQLERCGLK